MSSCAVHTATLLGQRCRRSSNNNSPDSQAFPNGLYGYQILRATSGQAPPHQHCLLNNVVRNGLAEITTLAKNVDVIPGTQAPVYRITPLGNGGWMRSRLLLEVDFEAQGCKGPSDALST